MTKTAAVRLTAEEIDELFDAIDEQTRHWEACGGDAEENARYARTIAGLAAIARKLENARDQLEGD
jgi:NTP pyrophosphatase (non-canonical NTP hydrolase)